jgi:NTP pyrophosphatase (non-canonical NTP hydrolase)
MKKKQISYDTFVHDTMTYPHASENMIYPVLGLLGEVGEIAEKVLSGFVRNQPYNLDTLHIVRTLRQFWKAGEYASAAKRRIREGRGDIHANCDTNIVEGLVAEIGDALWYLTALSHECGLPLKKVMEKNMEKLTSRIKRGTLYGKGDNR